MRIHAYVFECIYTGFLIASISLLFKVAKNIEWFLPAILEMKVIYSYMTNEVHNIMKE